MLAGQKRKDIAALETVGADLSLGPLAPDRGLQTPTNSWWREIWNCVGHSERKGPCLGGDT